MLGGNTLEDTAAALRQAGDIPSASPKVAPVQTDDFRWQIKTSEGAGKLMGQKLSDHAEHCGELEFTEIPRETRVSVLNSLAYAMYATNGQPHLLGRVSHSLQVGQLVLTTLSCVNSVCAEPVYL